MGRRRKDKKDVLKEDNVACTSSQPNNLQNFPYQEINYQAESSFLHENDDVDLFKTNIKNTSSKPNPIKQESPHYQGHRKRLRQRFISLNGQDMPDYEILELLLFRSQPRKDTKPLAKRLLARFGSLAAIFSSEIQELQQVDGCGESIAIDLKLIATISTRMLHSELPKRDIFTSWQKVIDYCRSLMAYEKREQFRVLFLDKKNGLIADKVMQTGTVDHTPVYPREVIKAALDYGASSLILVHNHPSGDPTPSRQDIAMTAKLQQLSNAMNMTIHDHLIIGRNSYTSLRELDLI